jgi:hypothetical protein
LKFHRSWNKQVAPKKGKIENPSSDKYVPPHRRHLSQEGNNFVLCKNANPKIVEPVNKHFRKQSAYLPSLWYHRTHQATLSSNPTLEAFDQETRTKDR